MSNSGYRIGDQERDRAIAQLREHHAAGRLDVAEFDERMAVALAARFASELDELFMDLPTSWRSPEQATRVPPSAEVQRYAGGGQVVEPAATGQTAMQKLAVGLNGALWPIIMVVQFATGFAHWWLWLLPLAVSPLLMAFMDDGKGSGEGRD